MNECSVFSNHTPWNAWNMIHWYLHNQPRRPLNYVIQLWKLNSSLRLCRLIIFRKSHLITLRSQIEGYTRLLIFKNFSTLPRVIWASPFINFQENFWPPCFLTCTNKKNSTLLAVIRAYRLLNLKKNSSLPFY